MLSILNLTKTNKLILATFAFLAVLAFGGGRAHAATLNVAGGCTLPIAINSVNAGANQSGCTATVSPDAYGTNDTITIPAGTVTLTNNLPTITAPVKVQGAGMTQTVINGDNGQYSGISATGVDVSFSDFKVTAYRSGAVSAISGNVMLQNIEVDGGNSTVTSGNFYGVYISNNSGSTKTVDADGVYIHNINVSAGSVGVAAFLVQTLAGGTTNATIKNTTLSNVHNTGGTLNGFTIAVGMLGGSFGDNGITNATVSNTTIDDVGATAAGATSAPFASIAFARAGNATVNTVVYNATITRTNGATGVSPPITGIQSGAFYAVTAGVLSGNVATSNVSIGNSLLASNTTDGTTSNNCSTADLTSGVGGAGSGVQSITSLGHNISDDASCTMFTEEGDQQNVNNIISTLGSLQNNGGNVPTRALLTGSPAIAAGSSVLGVTTDARGIARPGTCPSVGAFQFEGAVCAASTTNAGANAGAPNTGINPVSLLGTTIAVLLGLSAIGYTFSFKRSE